MLPKRVVGSLLSQPHLQSKRYSDRVEITIGLAKVIRAVAIPLKDAISAQQIPHLLDDHASENCAHESSTFHLANIHRLSVGADFSSLNNQAIH